MVFWAGIALALQAAAGPAAVDEQDLDLARLKPGVHEIAVPAEQPYQFRVSNRVPTARYREIDHGGSITSYLEPHRPRDGSVERIISPDPGCAELIAAIDRMMAAVDEAEAAARKTEAEAVAAKSSCPQAARAIRWATDKVQGIGASGTLGADQKTDLVIERLDAAGAVVRRWEFRFVAKGTWTPPAAWPAPTETAWLVGETVRDIVEIATLARKGPLAALPTASVMPAPGAPSRFAVSIGASGPARTITLTDTLWTPGAYEGLARDLLGAGAARHTGGAAPSSLDSLTDARAANLEREDRHISQRLNADPRDPGAHEAAALLLASLALREDAGRFSDIRLTLSRLTAHLALARALRAGSRASADGRIAELARLTLLGRQQEALDALSRSEAPTAAETSWVRALRLRNTGDWRILEQPLTATLLERLEHHRALAVSIGGSGPLEEYRRRNHEVIPDWGRAQQIRGSESYVGLAGIEQAGPTVESTNTLIGPLLGLELRQAAAVLGASRGSELPLTALVTALNAPAARGVTRDGSGRLVARVLGPGTWARFHQRHIAQAIYQTAAQLQITLSAPDRGTEFWAKAQSTFAGLELLPLLTAYVRYLPGGASRRGVSEAALLAEEQKEVCGPAAWMWEKAPERLTPAGWYRLRTLCRPAGEKVPLSRPERWFDPLLLVTTSEFDERFPLVKRTEEGSVPLLEKLRTMAPRHRAILAAYFCLRYRCRGGPSEFDSVFGPLADYDLSVMRRRAQYLVDDPERYQKLLSQIAAIDPDTWLDLGTYLAEHDRVEAAAQAFEAAVDKAADRVAVANGIEWLILYYADGHLEEKALALARQGVATGSGGGLVSMARLQEKLGHWDEAETYYRQNATRYGAKDELDAFYIRHDRLAADGRHADETRLAWARLFPDGHVKWAEGDLRAPSRGVQIVSSAASLQRQGLVKGAVIVARDGYRVNDGAQYRALQSFSDDAPATFVVWVDDAYKTIISPMPRPHPMIRLRTYRGR